MKVYRISLFLLLFYLPKSWSQSSGAPQLLDSVEVLGTLMAVDQLQQLYTLDEQQLLRKYDSKGLLLFEFQNSRLGTLKDIDVSDPFGILLNYSDFTTIVLLDRTLNPLIETNLANVGLLAPELLATARDNNIWMYDQQDFKLKKINRQGRVLLESQDLSVWFPEGINGLRLWVKEDAIFLENENHRLLAFNQFAQYQRSYTLPAARLLAVEMPNFLWQQKKDIGFTHSISGAEQILLSAPRGIDHCIIRRNLIYLQRGQQVFQYRL